MYEELTPVTSHLQGESVDFSSKHTVETLRKDLEKELRLDNADIRSYAWYHGRLPRDISEQLVRNQGDFLIRESVTNTGEHVLTMRWLGTVLHFKINKFTLQQSPIYSKIQFAFERDSFDSIPALIMFHVGRSIPISVASGAVIRNPINRELPLSYSDVHYASLRRQPKRNGSVPHSSSHGQSSSSTNFSNSQHSSPHPASQFAQQQNDSPSQNPRTNFVNKQNSYGPTSPQPFPLHLPENALQQDLNRTANAEVISKQPENVHHRNGSDHTLNFHNTAVQNNSDSVGPNSGIRNSPSGNIHGTTEVPPKPSRVPSFRRPVIRHDSGKMMKNGSVLKLQSVNEVNSGQNDFERKPGSSPEDAISKDSSAMTTTSPRSVTSLLGGGVGDSPNHQSSETRRSIFTPSVYIGTMLAEQNKPVEGDVMIEIKKQLLSTDPFKLARHMTYIDCEVCKINDLRLEDIFLSKGKQLRQDILERYQCFAFWVAVCVLRGGTTKQEKIDILNVFIKVANELVHSLGNVFGFSAVMHGLTCPPLRGLDELWGALQQQYTNNAVTMKKKLLPLIQLLDEGKGQISLNSTCVPHILPVLRYLENPLSEIPHSSPQAKASERKQLSASEGDMLGSIASEGLETTFWWQNLPDDSFDSLMSQLSIARSIIASLPVLRQNAFNKLQDFEKKPQLHEMLTTDFQLRFLFGYKGAESPRKERYQKFDKIITLTAKKLTP